MLLLLKPSALQGPLFTATTNWALTVNGATFSASTTLSTFVAGRAFDQNDGTEWGAVNSPANEWLKADLTLARQIGRFRVLQDGTNNGASQYKLQWSSDDAAWNDVVTVGTPIVADTGVLDFSPVTARYWRILGVSNQGTGGWSVFTFELWSPLYWLGGGL